MSARSEISRSSRFERDLVPEKRRKNVQTVQIPRCSRGTRSRFDGVSEIRATRLTESGKVKSRGSDVYFDSEAGFKFAFQLLETIFSAGDENEGNFVLGKESCELLLPDQRMLRL